MARGYQRYYRHVKTSARTTTTNRRTMGAEKHINSFKDVVVPLLGGRLIFFSFFCSFSILKVFYFIGIDATMETNGHHHSRDITTFTTTMTTNVRTDGCEDGNTMTRGHIATTTVKTLTTTTTRKRQTDGFTDGYTFTRGHVVVVVSWVVGKNF